MRREAERVIAELAASERATGPGEDLRRETRGPLAAYGLSSRGEEEACRRRVLREIVEPAIAALAARA